MSVLRTDYNEMGKRMNIDIKMRFVIVRVKNKIFALGNLLKVKKIETSKVVGMTL